MRRYLVTERVATGLLTPSRLQGARITMLVKRESILSTTYYWVRFNSNNNRMGFLSYTYMRSH